MLCHKVKLDMSDRRMSVNSMQVILPTYIRDLSIHKFWYVRGMPKQLHYGNLERGEKGGMGNG